MYLDFVVAAAGTSMTEVPIAVVGCGGNAAHMGQDQDVD